MIANENYQYTIAKEELSESGEKIGIEAEEENDVMEPFDPEAITIAQKVVPMDVLLRRLKQGSIALSPSFQRKEVWDVTRKSRLIESIMLRVPLPMFYVAADEKGNWEVVDGLQRLSTIRDFMLGDRNGVFLQLKGLEFLNERYGGKAWAAIENDSASQKLVNTIYETEMRFTIIEPGTPEAVKRNIFKRINTGGMPLTSQEIRHALYEGESSSLLQRLVNKKVFIDAVGKRIDDSRMGASELILRLVSFTLFPRSSYKSGMDNWLSNAMRTMNILNESDPQKLAKIFHNEEVPELRVNSIDEIEKKFDLAMSRASSLFGEHAFRKSLPTDERKSPINKALFEIWGNILADMSEDDFKQLIRNKYKIYEKQKELYNDLDFSNSISRHSSSSQGIINGYQKVKYLVDQIIISES
ncbi:DUF262 domain-containing protein [Vibrio cholerae]|nr:DUF262 domain-containing protein [Vibrio cholerae]